MSEFCPVKCPDCPARLFAAERLGQQEVSRGKLVEDSVWAMKKSDEVAGYSDISPEERAKIQSSYSALAVATEKYFTILDEEEASIPSIVEPLERFCFSKRPYTAPKYWLYGERVAHCGSIIAPLFPKQVTTRPIDPWNQ